MDDKTKYYTTAELNRQPDPAQSCKQNIITTTPLDLIITFPLTIYDQQLLFSHHTYPITPTHALIHEGKGHHTGQMLLVKYHAHILLYHCTACLCTPTGV